MIAADLERPACPLCGAWRPASAPGLRVVRCEVCAGRYLTPRFREHARTRAGGGRASSRRALEARAELLAAHAPRPGALLDLGAGDGTFLSIARARGWEVTGADLDPAALRRAKDRHGLDLILLDLDRDPLPRGRFDAVTLWGTLPELYRPHALLARIAEVLAPGGVLGIGAGGRSFGIDRPRRLVDYTPATLARLVAHAGYQVCSIQRRLEAAETIALFARAAR